MPNQIYMVPKSSNTKEEINFLSDAMQESKYYLEFGSGFSTTLATGVRGIKIMSIETDLDFLNDLSEYVLSKSNECDSINFIHLDIGPTKELGYPTSSDTQLLLNYSIQFSAKLQFQDFYPDLILIDGRFRVATFLMCVLNFPTAKMIFDDFENRRPIYGDILDIVPLHYSVGRIGVFYVPRILTPEEIVEIRELLTKHRLNPA